MGQQKARVSRFESCRVKLRVESSRAGLSGLLENDHDPSTRTARRRALCAVSVAGRGGGGVTTP